MKKYSVLILTVIVSIVLIAGCAKESSIEDAGSAEKTPAGNELKVALVSDVGGVNDNSFNQSAWEGLLRAETELGVNVSYVESMDRSEYFQNLETMLESENNLIWGVGYMMADAMIEAAHTNPDQKYAIIDKSYGDETPENLVGVEFKAEQAAFLVGYIAGKMTETGTVGFIGGIKGAIIDQFDYGYHAGVHTANPEVKVLRQYANSFTDIAMGKAIANSMYEDDADIVFHAAGPVGDGLIESAKEREKWAIGVDKDQNSLAPDNVLTSAMKRVDNAMFNVVKDLQEGKFNGGSSVVYGLSDGGVDIAPSSDKHVPASILEEVDALKKKVISGEIAVPFNKESYTAFIK